MPAKKERVSITLTKPYLDFIDGAIEDGSYLTRGEVTRAGLRLLMKEHKEAEDTEASSS